MRSHLRAGGQRSCAWQLRMAGENSPSPSTDEPSQSSSRSIVSAGCVRVAVLAGGVGELVSGLGHRLDDRRG